MDSIYEKRVEFHVSIWRWIARKETHVAPRVDSCRRRAIKGVHAPWMAECMTKRRGPIKGPRNDSRSAVSRSLTDTVGERIICAVNNGTAWQPIAPAYLLRRVDDPSLYYSEITGYLFALSREEGEKKRERPTTNWRVIL